MKPALRTLPISKTMPLGVGLLHFVGIGGIGMSGIAEVLHNLGYKVQGSDVADSPYIERLRGLGIAVTIGHQAANVKDASVVVVSSAIKADNPEMIAARDARIPVVKRAEMLAELMRLKMCVAIAGTHGKTTTTALMAAVFEAAGLQPTVINGGIINARGTNAYLGGGEWMVVEADESDGTFTRLPATIGIITNIDPEHLDHYGSFDAAKAAFQTFVTNLPFYGFAVACIDHPEVQALVARTTDRRIVTYGFSPQADVRAVNMSADGDYQTFDVQMKDRVFEGVKLSMHGIHNVSNACAAIAVGVELGMDDAAIKKALSGFEGVKRRFTKTGEAKGITVIDDYGHHPVEIAATLKAARIKQDATGGKVIAVVQPHRYTRLHDLMEEFSTCMHDADVVIVTDVYSAGEAPIDGVNAEALVSGLKRAGHKHAIKLISSPDRGEAGRRADLQGAANSEQDGPHPNPPPAGEGDMVAALASTVSANAGKGDLVVCLGAGSITKWAYALPKQIEAL